MRVLKGLRTIALLALLPAAWLALHHDMVHRSRLDPREPLYTSNYLDARGLGFPWLVTEVPADLAPIGWTQRVYPRNLVLLYVVALVPACALWAVGAVARVSWRWIRGVRL